MTITVELTPDLAEAFLSRNKNNRTRSFLLVCRYARDILDGRWEHNGEPIIVANTGELNDGQHRCAAVIHAQRSIITQVTFGVKRETRSTIDIGKKRTVGQHLQTMGFPNGNNLAHTILFIWMMETHGKISTHPIFRPTAPEVLDWVSEHPEIHEYITKSIKVGSAVKVSRGLIASLWYRFAKLSERDADKFFEKLESGTDLGSTDPIYRLRERLRVNSTATAKLPQSEIAALTIKAWNFYRKGAQVKSLSRRTKGEVAEHFPIPE
jgi:hypothetical protein